MTFGSKFVLLISSPEGYISSKVLAEEKKSSKGFTKNWVAKPTTIILFLIAHMDLLQLLITIYAQGRMECGGMVWQFL